MFKIPTETDIAPSHPGEILREDILPCLAMTRQGFARHLDLSEDVLLELLSERRPVDLTIAQRLGAALGQGAAYWLALQMQHDLWHAARPDPAPVAPIPWTRRALRRPRPEAPHSVA